MKKLNIVLPTLIILIFVCVVCAHAGGLSQGVKWEQGPLGYGTKIYIGTVSGYLQYSYDGGIDTRTFTITDLPCETKHYAAASHYADIGDGFGMRESELTPEISFITAVCISVTFNPMSVLPDPITVSIPSPFTTQ